MKITFLSNTNIKDVESHIQSLRPIEGKAKYNIVSAYPTLLNKEGLILRHWAEEDDGDDTMWAGFALPMKGGWTIYAASGLQKTTFIKNGKGTIVTYEGPLNGLGESPYTRYLFTPKEVIEGKVEATRYKGNFMGYLNHRLVTVAKMDAFAGGEKFISGCGLPTILQSDVSLYLIRKETPVEGYENLWPGTVPELIFALHRPKGHWAEVIEVLAYQVITPGGRQYQDGPEVPEWITEAL